MSKESSPTLGSKIDAVLAPFVQDEAHLAQRLDELNQDLEKLQADIAQANEDLQVVEAAKIDALRDAAASDPLLSVVLAGMTGGAAPAGDEPELEVVEEENDGHRLLSPA